MLSVLIFVAVLHAKEPNAFCRDVRAKTASVSVSLDYRDARRGVGAALTNPKNDERVARTWAKTASGGRHTEFNDANIPQTKAQFLKQLQEKIGTSEYVNFNYSGHGHRLNNGDWGFPLPGAPADLVDHCKGLYKWEDLATLEFGDGPQPKSPDQDCARMKDYFVTGADLRSAFRGKKVFAVLDACHAGSMYFDEGAALVATAQDKTATDGMGSEKNGLLVKTVKQMTEGCDLDRESGEVVASDLTARFALLHTNETERDAIATALRTKKTTYSYPQRQQMGLIQKSPAPWLGCVKLGTVNPAVRAQCRACKDAAVKAPGTARVSCLARLPVTAGQDPGAFQFPPTAPVQDEARD